MTNTAQKAQEFPVHFGWDSVEDNPSEAIGNVARVVAAMNHLLIQDRDPNELGENPNGDERIGINLIFSACVDQLQTAARVLIERQGEPCHDNDSTYPKLSGSQPGLDDDPDLDELDLVNSQVGEWHSAAEWTALGLDGMPVTRQGFHFMAKRECWVDEATKARKRSGRGGGWEYHIGALPKQAQIDWLARRTDTVKKATNG